MRRGHSSLGWKLLPDRHFASDKASRHPFRETPRPCEVLRGRLHSSHSRFVLQIYSWTLSDNVNLEQSELRPSSHRGSGAQPPCSLMHADSNSGGGKSRLSVASDLLETRTDETRGKKTRTLKDDVKQEGRRREHSKNPALMVFASPSPQQRWIH